MAKQIDNNVPLIRFEGFEDDWVEQKLKDIVEVYSGRDYKHLSVGDIPVYGTGGYMLSVDEALSYDQDAIGIGRKGTINKPYLLKCPFWTVDTLFYAVPREGYDLNFSFCIFQKTDWKKKDESTGVPSLSRRAINETRTFTPNENEQHRISLYFKEFDRVIELHQHKHNKLVTLKQAMLQKMFPQDGATTPEIRFKGFAGDWEKKELQTVCEIIGGGTPSTTIPEYWGGNIDWYSPTEIGSEVYANGSVKKITQLGLKKSSARMLPANKTVLFTSRAGIGDMAILKQAGCTNQGFQSLVLHDGVDPYFIYSIGYLIKDYALRHASGSTFLEISSKQLGRMPVLLPKDKEQQQIGAYFRKLDLLISQHSTQLDKLKQIKSACLERMFV